MSQFDLKTWMSHLHGHSLYWIAGLALVAIAALRLLVTSLARFARDPHPYRAAPALLTAAERAFFVALRQAVGAE